jgi:predicted dehydrogenase
VRVGVIGCGYWGPKLARNFNELPGAELVAVADLDPDRRDHMETRFPAVAVVGDHTALLEMELDAVAVATPVSTHYELGLAAINSGKHVLIEKPLASSSAEANELIEAAAGASRTLLVGHTFEYNAAVEKLRDLVRSGDLGQIYYVNAARVNLGIFQTDVNVLWDLAAHDISILQFVLGTAPTSVRAHGVDHVQPGIEDVAWLTLKFPDSVTAHIHTSWLDPCKIRRVTVVGDRKMVVYDDVAALDKITIYDRGVEHPPYTDNYGEFQLSYRYGDVYTPRLNWVEPLKRECEHFLACINSGEQPRSNGDVGRRVVQVLEAADHSLANGGSPVEVDL